MKDVTEIMVAGSESAENLKGKRENASFQNFLLFPHGFQEFILNKRAKMALDHSPDFLRGP